jgi:hypothetical protein
MNPQTKLTATIIWFSILSGVFVMLQFFGDGIASLSTDFTVRSVPLLLVAMIPPVVTVIGRMEVIPKAKSDQGFIQRLVLCLALCEAPVILALIVFPKDFTMERTFAFISSVLALLVLFPPNMPYLKKMNS